MMMKKIYMLIAGVTFTLLGYGQTTQQQAEKQIEDSLRKADAGKADVISTRNKAIFDSTTFNADVTKATNNKDVKKSAKKKHCGNRAKRNSKAGALKKKD
jgi:hypothetical protein